MSFSRPSSPLTTNSNCSRECHSEQSSRKLGRRRPGRAADRDSGVSRPVGCWLGRWRGVGRQPSVQPADAGGGYLPNLPICDRGTCVLECCNSSRNGVGVVACKWLTLGGQPPGRTADLNSGVSRPVRCWLARWRPSDSPKVGLPDRRVGTESFLPVWPTRETIVIYHGSSETKIGGVLGSVLEGSCRGESAKLVLSGHFRAKNRPGGWLATFFALGISFWELAVVFSMIKPTY